MLAVFGLGNPGRKYEGTRHNVGFEVVDRVAKELGASAWQSRSRVHALMCEVRTAADRVLLVKPQTYMNESGRSVAAVVRWNEIRPDEFLVVCDDIDLDLAVVRVRRKGSSGGHNGLKSVSDALGTTDFPRLRIGVGRPAPEDAIEYVLGRFSRAEREEIGEAIERAACGAVCWVTEGIEACMNKFN